jgi:hypothetical protein
MAGDNVSRKSTVVNAEAIALRKLAWDSPSVVG